MKPEVKAEWVAALRSGQYPQCQEALIEVQNVDGVTFRSFCCLGVLTDLAIKAGAPGVRYKPDEEYEDVVQTWDEEWQVWFDHESGDLPPPVVEWAGITSVDPVDPEVPDPDAPSETVGLITLNDDRRLTFDLIADVIEGSGL